MRVFPTPKFRTCCPYQKEPSISPLVEFGHDTVDDVRLRSENVDRVHVSLGYPPVFKALNVWLSQAR